MFANKKLLILIIVVVIVSFAILLVGLITPRKKTINPTVPVESLSPKPTSQQLKSINPDPLQELTPGSRPIFVLEFTQPLDLNNTLVAVTKVDRVKDEPPQNLQTQVSFSNSNKVISITLNEAIIQSSKYILSLKEQSSNKNLLEKFFLSSFPQEPKPSNDPILIKYLPYGTETFALVWDTDKNQYVFHFRVNINSPESAANQYEAAKNEAVRFIKGKGVDPNSLNIDWRHS